MNLTFITGPVRSGKSRFAMRSAHMLDRPVVFLAAGASSPDDAEWNSRIEHHRLDRPKEWTTIETAGDRRVLDDAIGSCSPDSTILIDSVGTWLADQFSRLRPDADTPERLEALLDCGRYFIDAIVRSQSGVIAVSEETGWGVHPEHATGRIFRDALGFTNQRLARIAQRSYLVVCGYAIDLKTSLHIGDYE